MRNTKITLTEIVAKIDSLPQLPEVAMRLVRLMEDPNIDASRLAEVIRLDPGLTAQVLRLCNSAAYGFSRKIMTVKEAVAILGFSALRSMVYVIVSKFALDKPVDGYGLQRGQLWRNALTCAVYGKALAERTPVVNPELVFTGALLRDIGKLVLGEYVGANYAEIEALAQSQQIDFVQAEEQVVGFNHTLVGTRLAEKWNLPEKLVKVIRYHHQPSMLISKEKFSDGLSEDARLTTMVHLADALTMMIGGGVGNDGLMYTLDVEALSQIGITVDDAFLEATLARLSAMDQVIDDMMDSLSEPGA